MTKSLRESITVKNYREYYHDALEQRESCSRYSSWAYFFRGRAKGEVLFWSVRTRG